jgi:transcriptional regulator with XRE-family HTH domain
VASSRIGGSLRSARERAGWSREALAYHSGLSWAAIAQIESGRRKEVRVSSLLALAGALEVSVDYLVGGAATVFPDLLEHRGLIYRSEDDSVASAAPYLVAGITHSECVLAVTSKRRMGLLRDTLGDNAQYVEFSDSSEWYRSPHDASNGYQTFVKERFERGAPWIRILGEPVWAGRSEAEVAEWIRYESMMNLSFASSPATIFCPYDARSVPDGVLAGARCTHPEVAEAGAVTASLAYREPEDFLLVPQSAGISSGVLPRTA